MNVKIAELKVAPNINLYHVGPPLDLGPLPSLFYFSLSGPDSLGLDPFNQPVQFSLGRMIRIFSLTLPAHENDLPPTQALKVWAEDYAKGADPLGEFLNQCALAVDFAIREKFGDPEKLAVAGLSRGGLLAFHLAAQDERFKSILAFAPITRLSKMKEFVSLKPNPFFEAENLAESLCDRSVRLYIGNQDVRVGTRFCFDFAMALTDCAKQKKIRSPQIECFITPSIGIDGHGTSPEVFRQGTDWIASCLGIKL